MQAITTYCYGYAIHFEGEWHWQIEMEFISWIQLHFCTRLDTRPIGYILYKGEPTIQDHHECTCCRAIYLIFCHWEATTFVTLVRDFKRPMSVRGFAYVWEDKPKVHVNSRRCVVIRFDRSHSPLILDNDNNLFTMND